MQLILPHLYTFSGLGIGRVYLVEDPDGLTLIDTGLASAASRILDQVDAMDRRPSDIRRILITHGHPDHVGALPELKDLTGAEVFASHKDRALIEGREPIPTAPLERLSAVQQLMARPGTVLPGVPVDVELEEGDSLPFFGGLRVLFTPGHSHGHLSFWQPARRVLFCGDVVMRLPNLQLPFAAYTVDMLENRRSLQRLAGLNPAVVCFGHGAPLTQRAAEQLRAFAAKTRS